MKKLLPAAAAAVVLGLAGGAFAQQLTGDCCSAGAACCHPGASCCHHGGQAQR